jgi:hypothetical protein
MDAGAASPNKSHYYVKGDLINPNRPRDWTSPVDNRNGTVHIRTEVIEKPAGGEPTTWTLCYIPNKGQGNGYGCTGTVLYKEKGIRAGRVHEILVAERRHASDGSGHAHKRPDPEHFFPTFPTKMRITRIQV